MTTPKNRKYLSEKYDDDYIRETSKNCNFSDDPVDPNETLNPNLDSAAEDLDDICTSISQKPVNPLYVGTSYSVNKIVLPTASLVEDDRFWREQVNRSDEMASNVREAQEEAEEMQEQQIVTLASSSSSSPDSFTPFKTIKDRCPDVITRWSVSLLHGNLLIVGHDKDGKKAIARVCNRRVSSYIFHDSNDIVCSLLGPSDPDSNVPKYILEKFKMGIPEDWRIVIQYWRHYKSLNCPVKFNWPSLPHSSSFNQTTNWYTIPDTDTSFAESGRMSVTAQQLSKKIAKMQKMLRATLLKESFSNSKLLDSTLNSNRENSIKSDSLSNRQISNDVDSILLRKNAINNNLSNINRVVGSNSNSTASKVQNIGSNNTPNKNIIFSGKNNFEKVIFHNKTPAKSVEYSSESEEFEPGGTDTKLNDNSILSSESSFHLEPLISENSQPKDELINEKKFNSGSDIFSNAENKKIANKKIDTVKTSEKKIVTSGTSSSFVAIKSSEIKDSTIGQKSIKNKVVALNSVDKLKDHNSNSEISVSSRGRIRVSTLPFWQDSRLIVEKDAVKIISSSNSKVQNTQNSDVFRKPPEINSLKKISKKKILNESEVEKSHDKSQPGSSLNKSVIIVLNKNNAEVLKRSRKQASNKSESEGSQSESSNDKSIDILSNTTEELLKPSEGESVKKRGRKTERNQSESERSQPEFIPETSTKIVASNTGNSEKLLISPEGKTIKKRGRKSGKDKSESERFESEASPEESLKSDAETAVKKANPEELLTSNTETSKKRGKKKGWNKSETESVPEKSTKIVASNTGNTEKLVKSLDGKTNIKRGRKSGRNKSESERSESESSAEESLKSNVETAVKKSNTEELLKSPNPETIKKRGRKKGWNKSESESLPEKSIITAGNPEKLLDSPDVETVIKRGKKKGSNKSETERSQSPEKSTKIISNTTVSTFLKPPDIATIKRKRGRKKGSSNTTSFSQISRSDSNVSNDVSSSQMSGQSVEEITTKSQNSIGMLSQLSDASNSSSVSSRGRRRVSTLPFWQGQRLTVYKQEVVIQKTLTLSCNIDSYINNSNADISINTKTSKKNNQSNRDRDGSPVQSYQEVFNETAFKKPEKKPVTQMQLMSTLRDSFNNDTINKSNVSTCRTNSPFRKQINNIVNNNSNKSKNIINKPQSNSPIRVKEINKSSLEVAGINIAKEKINSSSKNKITSGQSPKKSIPKQLKELRNITEETNDSSVPKQSPFKRRTRSSSKKLNDEELPIFNQLSQTKQFKNSRKNHIVEDKYDSSPKRSRSPSKKQNDKESPIYKQSSNTKQLRNSRKNHIVEDRYDSSPRRTRSPSKKQNNEESPNYKQSSNTKQLQNRLKNHVIEDQDDLSPKDSPFRRRTRSPSKKQNEEESSNYKQSSSTKQLPNPRKNHVTEDQDDLSPKDSPFKRRTRSPSKKQNDEESSNYKQSSSTKQLPNPRKNHVTEDTSRKDSPIRRRSRSPSKKQNDKESSSYKQSSSTKQHPNPRKNYVVENKDVLSPKEAEFRKRTRSVSKKQNNEEESPNYKHLSSTKQLRNSPKKQVVEDYLTPKKSPLKKRNRSTSKKLNHKNDFPPKESPVKKRTRSSAKKLFEEEPEINNKPLPQVKNILKVTKTKSNIKVSRKSTPYYNTRKKTCTVENNFNFTIENISHIEDNIPNKRSNNNNNKNPRRMSPRQTTQFKLPKRRIIKQIQLPANSNDLYLFVNKNKKSKKREPKSVVKTLLQESFKMPTNYEPKKRKLFKNSDWMNSVACLEHLSQNNIEEQRSKFVLSLDPLDKLQEFDIMSEVSALL